MKSVTTLSEENSGSVTITGSVKRALGVYAGPFAIGAVLTYIFAAMLRQTGHYVLLVLLIPLYALVFWDLISWLRQGVRVVELNSTGLIITRAGSQSPEHISSDRITAVYVSKSFDRTTINILLKGAQSTTFLGLRRYSGPRIRMTVEPFDRREFSEFAQRVSSLRRTPA